MPDLELVLVLASVLVLLSILASKAFRLRRDDVMLLLADDPALRELEARGELVREPALWLCEVERSA